MKKIIMSMFTMAVASFAFAITDAQKTAFAEKVRGDYSAAFKANDAKGDAKVKWGIIFPETYESFNMAALTKPIAEWAVASPLEYRTWLETAKLCVYGDESVRKYINDNSLINWETCSPEQSAAIFDHRKQYDDAMIDKSKYSAMKSAGFVVGGIKMSNAKIQALAKKHGDIATYESMFTDEQLAQRFDEYIDIAVIAASQMNTKGAVYNLYAGIEARFEFKTNVSAVSKNWARFTAMLDAAAKRYERAIQFGEEQPK